MMKKLNYLILGLAGLTLASCSNDDLLGPAKGDGNVNLTVKLPADMATRALGDGLTADVLRIAVYDADNSDAFVFDMEASFGGALQTTVSMNLPQKKNYNIAFFAVSKAADGTLYSFLPKGDAEYENPYIKVNYEDYGSDPNLADAFDCFYKLEHVSTANGSALNKEVILTRPVAQINWGTSDLSQAVVDDAAFGENGKNLLSNLTIDDAPYQLDFFNGVTDNTKEIVIEGLASPASETSSAAWTFPVNPSVYKYIAMQYVLAPSNPNALYNISLDVYNTGGDVKNEAIEVANAPLQANYRTNIYGALLTNPTEFTVIKNNEWGQPDYDPSLELAFQRGGSFTLEKDFEVDGQLVVKGNLNLNLNGHNIVLNYPGDGMILVNGGNLTITGEGSVTDGNSNDNYNALVGVIGGGTVTIEGGNYVSYGNGQVIYVQEGIAYIKGGSYELKNDPENKNWCLNCQDANYKAGKAKIVVTGGTYYNWDPANNNAEGDDTNYVAKGYQVISADNGRDVIYTVIPSDAIIVDGDNTTMAQALENAKDGDTIYVMAGTFATPNTFDKSVTIKGVGAEMSFLDTKNAYFKSEGADLTFEDLSFNGFANPYNHTSMGIQGAANQTYNNVTFHGEFHVFTGNATFNNCSFVYDAATGTNYQLWCQTNGTVDVNNCAMDCANGRAILVYGWPGSGNQPANNTVGGDININGLTVTSTGNSSDKAVVEIHSELYTSAGTININNLTYSPQSDFAGLWRDVNSTTKFYTVYVNGQLVQQGNN